jgi:RecA-family ATPase
MSDPFADFAALGYGSRLIPIIPPKAPISDRSNLFKRIAAGDDARGKAPGVRWPDGRWSGFDWRIHQTTPSDLGRWANMGAGVGVKCGDGLAVIDADTLSEDIAAVIKAKVEAIVGLLPVRIGRYPKAAYVVRVEGPYRHALLEFGHANGRPRERVEILGEGRQFVAAGVHPATGQPYRWPRGAPRLEDVPSTTPEALNALMEALRGVLPEAGPVSREGTGGDVDQALLRGRAETVRTALRALPNTHARFPTRESYLAVGYAIQAALPDEPETGLSLFEDWCAGYVGPNGETNDPEVVRGDWRRMKPPFRRGASWLYEMAREASGSVFSATTLDHHEEIVEHESIFPVEPPHESAGAAAELQIVSAATLSAAEPPAQSWLAPGLIPTRNVTMLSGDGGAGKSLLMLQLAAAKATGSNWLGMPIERGRALFLTAEDEMDELHRRVAAILRGTTAFAGPDLVDLHLVSLDGRDAVLAAPTGKDGLLRPTAMMAKVKAAIETLRPALVVLDTLADLFGGDEIKRVHARQFIGLLKGLCNDCDTTVVLLAHPSLTGMASGTGTSGNTAWNNSVRSRLYLERRFGKNGIDEDDPDLRILTTKKSNRARHGVRYVVRWASGRFVREGVEIESREADDEREAEEKFLKILAQMDAGGRTVSHLVAAPNYAPKLMEGHPLALGIARDRMKEAMERLFARGDIVAESFGPPSRMRQKIAITKRTASDSDDLFG